MPKLLQYKQYADPIAPVVEPAKSPIEKWIGRLSLPVWDRERNQYLYPFFFWNPETIPDPAVRVLIGNQAFTDAIVWQSLKIENILTQQTDRCTFQVRKHPGKAFSPRIGAEVAVYDYSEKVFGGTITRIKETGISYPMTVVEVECTDFNRVLNQRLVSGVYQNMTIGEIVESIIDNYTSGFTRNNVACDLPIDYARFNYEPVGSCIRQLAELAGFDWYVDYDKDVHFFDAETRSAPVDIEDDTGVYEFSSLVLRSDNSQLTNSVVVRGGEYLGATVTAVLPAESGREIYNLPYRYNNFHCTVTGEVQTVGIDYIDDPNDYDVLYGFSEKVLRFPDGKGPTSGTIRVSGQPYLPVIVKLKAQPDIDSTLSVEGFGTGMYEKIIIDKTINSREAARKRALAELMTYAETVVEGEFLTQTRGFVAGQKVRVNSAVRGVDAHYIISRVTRSMRTPESFQYKISLVSTKTYGLIEFLRKLAYANTKEIEIGQEEVVDLVDAQIEGIRLAEQVTSSLSHNQQTEATTLGEVFTDQALNYAVEFCLGAQTPSGTKRVFILSGSPLA